MSVHQKGDVQRNLGLNLYLLFQPPQWYVTINSNNNNNIHKRHNLINGMAGVKWHKVHVYGINSGKRTLSIADRTI